jgi:hypothetical protein
VKHEWLEQTVRYQVGQDKQRRFMWKRISKRFSLTQGQGHDERIREVLQYDSRSSMYNLCDYIIVFGRRRMKLL